MESQGEEGHVVNTSSTAGLVSAGGIYGITKHAIVSLSEGLFHQLAGAGSKVHCSVLCPGIVKTNIIRSERNRPHELMENGAPKEPTPADLAAASK